MPLEFALRPRFDLKRPAPRRRPSWLRLHPLVLPIGAYWLTAAGLTYAFIRSASVDVAAAAEHGLGSGDSLRIDAPSSEPPIQSPISAGTVGADVIQGPAKQKQEPDSADPPDPPDPVPAAEPLEDEPFSQQELDTVARASAEDRKRVSRQAPAPVFPEEVRTKVRSPEPAPERVEEPALPRPAFAREVEPEQSPRGDVHTGSLPSCESAAATANQSIDIGSARGAPDLTRDAFAGVLEHGAYLAQCAIPPRTAVELCAAVRDGTVVGVTVTTEPRDPAVNACVRRAVSRLRFPRSSQLDVTRTRFEPVR